MNAMNPMILIQRMRPFSPAVLFSQAMRRTVVCYICKCVASMHSNARYCRQRRTSPSSDRRAALPRQSVWSVFAARSTARLRSLTTFLNASADSRSILPIRTRARASTRARDRGGHCRAAAAHAAPPPHHHHHHHLLLLLPLLLPVTLSASPPPAARCTLHPCSSADRASDAP